VFSFENFFVLVYDELYYYSDTHCEVNVQTSKIYSYVSTVTIYQSWALPLQVAVIRYLLLSE
jgi:hypothetical protein